MKALKDSARLDYLAAHCSRIMREEYQGKTYWAVTCEAPLGSAENPNLRAAIDECMTRAPKAGPVHKLNKAEVKEVAALMGSKGGKKSRRKLTPEQAKAMVASREAKRKKP